MDKKCPVCNQVIQKSKLRIHILKHVEISLERRIRYIDVLVNPLKRRRKKRSNDQKSVSHSITHRPKKTKSSSIYWKSVIKSAFESNRRKY